MPRSVLRPQPPLPRVDDPVQQRVNDLVDARLRQLEDLMRLVQNSSISGSL